MRVVTSGMGGVFPSGLVGTVSKVEELEQCGRHEYLRQSGAISSRSIHVCVVRRQGDSGFTKPG